MNFPAFWSLRAFVLVPLLVMAGCQHARKSQVQVAPAVHQLKRLATLSSGVVGLAWHNERLWISKYHGRGEFLRVHPETWQSESVHIQSALEFAPMGGGICFAGNELWVGDSYGEALGSVDLETKRVVKVFRGKHLPEKEASQSYASLAFDGTNLWMAFHFVDYVLPPSQTQLLLQRDKETGKILKTLPSPAGPANDSAHGLTWDGRFLWHGKDNRLCKVDPQSGEIKADYRLPGIERISGLAWHANTMWIIEFTGALWELPFVPHAGRASRH